VRRPSLGLRQSTGASLPGRGRNWLLGGTTVLLVIVAGTLLVGRIGEEPTPAPPGSSERPRVSTVTVPDLQGLTASEAKDRLTEEGLVLNGVVPVIGPPGIVRNNLPAPGESVAPAAGVVLFIGVEPDRFEEEVPTP
jgi:PASTA domain